MKLGSQATRQTLRKYCVWRRCPRPVFILGCGRSGTTILGESLSRHPQITYLNERRDLWAACFPHTDILSARSAAVDGRMVLTAADAAWFGGRQLEALFAYEAEKAGGSVLVEKTPINNFRVEFIDRIFPESKYVYIFRNGIEVARSIAKEADRNRWFGHNDYKWHQLVQYATACGKYPRVEEFPRDNYERGLLEWRLSTEHALEYLGTLHPERVLKITYMDFVDTPVETMEYVLNFTGVTQDEAVNAFLRAKVHRRSAPAEATTVADREFVIGGALLERSK